MIYEPRPLWQRLGGSSVIVGAGTALGVALLSMRFRIVRKLTIRPDGQIAIQSAAHRAGKFRLVNKKDCTLDKGAG